MDVQRLHVEKAMRMCRVRQPPIDWLFLLDDDELLQLFVPLALISSAAPLGTACLHFENLEAAPSSAASANVFRDVPEFVARGRLAYANGKSAGHTSQSAWLGCHFFRGPVHEVPRAQGQILHYESCTFAIWAEKFRRQRFMPAEVLAEIPFPFYRDSILVFRAEIDSGRNDVLAWKFYRERKLGHYAVLPRLRVDVSMPALRMI